MKPLDIFRKHVLNILEQQQWSQADLAKRTEIAQPTINVYLNGKKDPNVETCERIANALGAPLFELFKPEVSQQVSPPHTVDDCIRVAIGARGNLPPGLNLLHFWKLSENENGFISNVLVEAFSLIASPIRNSVLATWEYVLKDEHMRKAVLLLADVAAIDPVEKIVFVDRLQSLLTGLRKSRDARVKKKAN
jgi:transcriptional regulator with XRE-family HTH domain